MEAREELMTKEYGQIKPEEMSVATVLDTRTMPTGAQRIWTLKHHTAGLELAGSCARSTKERWSVTHFDCGANAIFGNSFSTLDAAMAVFHSDKPGYVPKPTDKPTGKNGLRTRK